jgi:MarR family transcriptional regulator, organic hydroperoxide resistance regulator
MDESKPAHLLHTLERASQAVSRLLARKLSEFDLTEAEGHVIFHIVEIGPDQLAGIPDLNRAFGMRPSTLTAVLDRLERRGLIERKVNPNDRRSSLLVPTPAGTDAAGEVAGVFDAIEARALSAVSEVQLAGFAAVMTAIERACG